MNINYQSDYKADGYDAEGKLTPYGAYDCYGGVRTHDDYWDCGCDVGKYQFIHAKAEALSCSKCGDTEPESSDSRVNEVAEKFGWIPENMEVTL